MSELIKSALQSIELQQDGNRIRGYAIRFGPDGIVGRSPSFLQSTDLLMPGQSAHDDGFVFAMKPTPLLIDHGFNALAGQESYGSVMATKVDEDEGAIFFEAMLDSAARYAKEVKALIEAGVMKVSVGTSDHLLSIVGDSFARFPVIETSLTPTPRNALTSSELQSVQSMGDEVVAFCGYQAQEPDTRTVGEEREAALAAIRVAEQRAAARLRLESLKG